MRRLPVLLACALVIPGLCVFALGAGTQVEIEQTPVHWRQVAVGGGGELYAELCASCHGADATGRGPAAPALATPVPDLTRLALRHGGVFPLQEVEATIAGERPLAAHEREMPRWEERIADTRPDLKPAHRESYARQRIHDLTAWLETVQVR